MNNITSASFNMGVSGYVLPDPYWERVGVEKMEYKSDGGVVSVEVDVFGVVVPPLPDGDLVDRGVLHIQYGVHNHDGATWLNYGFDTVTKTDSYTVRGINPLSFYNYGDVKIFTGDPATDGWAVVEGVPYLSKKPCDGVPPDGESARCFSTRLVLL